MRPVVLVSVVVPVLVGLSACCGKQETIERTFDFSVDPLELADALDADGNLTAEGCAALCEARANEELEVLSVESCSEAPPSEGASDAAPAESGDTGAVAWTFLTCTVTGTDICVGGRDHRCIDGDHSGTGPTPLAAWLAAQAHAEATSVKAFVAMGLELRRFGAPDTLVTRCTDAARDEIAHARILRQLCGVRGGTPAPIAFGPVPVRTLVDFAIENAVEGCVRETATALVAAWQASHAEQADVRAAFSRIARDEARHGDLAFAIDAWVREQLTDDECARVDAARRVAIDALLDGVGEPDPELRRGAGLPDRRQARTLLRRLDAAVWTPALAAA